MRLEAPIPVLRVFDHVLARRFYVDWLGFRVDWEHQLSEDAPVYLQVSRDAAVLHLSEHYGDASPGARIRVGVDDVEAYHRELHSRPNPNMNPGIETTPWGTREMGIVDPFGNRIVFSEPVL